MIRLCELCWLRLSRGEADDLRPASSKLLYRRGDECAFLHVVGADKRLAKIGETAKKKEKRR